MRCVRKVVNKKQKHCNKSIDDFYIDQRRGDGHYPICKSCHREYSRERYKNNEHVRKQSSDRSKRLRETNEGRDAIARRGDKYYSSIHGRAKTLWRGAHARDASATLTLEKVTEMLQRGVCSVTGIPFDLSSGYRRRTGRNMNPLAPSLDQIVAGAGYTNENTRIVIWHYNWMKGQFTDFETYLMAKAIVASFEK